MVGLLWKNRLTSKIVRINSAHYIPGVGSKYEQIIGSLGIAGIYGKSYGKASPRGLMPTLTGASTAGVM
jgi:hypothetical protein